MEEDIKSRLLRKRRERDEKYEEAHRASQEFWELIEESGLNVSQLAKLFGVDRKTVYQWRTRSRATKKAQ